MKKHLLFVLAFAAGMITTTILGWRTEPGASPAQKASSIVADNPDHRPIIAVRKVKLKPGTSEQAFEAFATKLANGSYGKMPGVKEYFAKGERGDDVGSYIYVVEFDSKITRDFYYPIEGGDDSKTSSEAKKFIAAGNQLAPDFLKLADLAVSGNANAKNYTDYIMIR